MAKKFQGPTPSQILQTDNNSQNYHLILAGHGQKPVLCKWIFACYSRNFNLQKRKNCSFVKFLGLETFSPYSVFVVKYFFKNAPKFCCRKIFLQLTHIHRQEEGVAWWYFCEINFCEKAKNSKFAKIFTTKINWYNGCIKLNFSSHCKCKIY